MRKFLLITASIVCFLFAGFATLMSGFYGVKVKTKEQVTLETEFQESLLLNETPEVVETDSEVESSDLVEEIPTEEEVVENPETPVEPEAPDETQETPAEEDNNTSIEEPSNTEETLETSKTIIVKKDLGVLILEKFHLTKMLKSLGSEKVRMIFSGISAIFYVLFTFLLIIAFKYHHVKGEKSKKNKKHKKEVEVPRSQYYEAHKNNGNLRF